VKKNIIALMLTGVVIGVLAAFVIIKPDILNPGIAKADGQLKTTTFVNSLDLLKQDLFINNIVLNANRNYKNLNGTVTKSDSSGIQSRAVFSIEQPSRFKLIYTPNINEPNNIVEAVNDGSKVQTNDSKQNKFDEFLPMKPMATPKVPDESAVIPDYNGTFLPTGGINELIHPEMYIQSTFRNGTISLLKDEKFLSRNTKVYQLDYKQSKLGTKQQFWFDSETGIILKTIIFNGDKIVQTYAFDSIDYPNKINDLKFKLLK
jgi:outer membrane lipoprotein-sorting protein